MEKEKEQLRSLTKKWANDEATPQEIQRCIELDKELAKYYN